MVNSSSSSSAGLTVDGSYCHWSALDVAVDSLVSYIVALADMVTQLSNLIGIADPWER